MKRDIWQGKMSVTHFNVKFLKQEPHIFKAASRPVVIQSIKPEIAFLNIIAGATHYVLMKDTGQGGTI